MPSADGSSSDPINLSGWHSIRPWNPPLTLNVREITSVSVTFILSGDDASADPTLSALGLGEEDSTENTEYDDDEDQKKQSFVSCALAGGLSVEVDAAPWRKVFIRVDDKADEAVIIIYGLMPGRQYDIELELIQSGHKNNLRRQIVTEESDQNGHVPDDNIDDSNAQDNALPETQLSVPSSSPGTNGAAAASPMPSPGFAPLTLEDRLNQLQHTLSVITAERDSLTATLKTARRDAQKADAALRSEIEILKRASEKHNSSEHRAKQKVLALQEAVKRAQTSTKEMEDEVTAVNESLPGVQSRRDEKEHEYRQAKSDADRIQKERNDEAEKERKRVEGMRGELSTLTNKLDRFNGKKERLETGTIPDLQQQLSDIEREIQKIELDPIGYAYASDADEMNIASSESLDAIPDQYFPLLRSRNPQATHPLPIGIRQPIQRPAPFQARQSHNQRSSSVQFTQTPVLLTNPNRQSPQSSSVKPPVPLANSTLSRRAPPFEPGRPLRSTGLPMQGGLNRTPQ